MKICSAVRPYRRIGPPWKIRRAQQRPKGCSSRSQMVHKPCPASSRSSSHGTNITQKPFTSAKQELCRTTARQASMHTCVSQHSSRSSICSHVASSAETPRPPVANSHPNERESLGSEELTRIHSTCGSSSGGGWDHSCARGRPATRIAKRFVACLRVAGDMETTSVFLLCRLRKRK